MASEKWMATLSRSCLYIDRDSASHLKMSNCKWFGDMELNIDDEFKLEQLHVDDVYEQMAPHYCTIKQKAWPKVKDFLKNLAPGSLVADIGCGTGRYLGVNPSIFTCGSDKCLQLVGHGRSRGYEVLAADNLHLPFKDGCFDAVISIGVIHHFSTRKRRVRAMRELSRILRPGGKMMIYVWAFEQRSRKFECQDVLVPWKNVNDSVKSRLSIEKDFPSSSSISEDDVFVDSGGTGAFDCAEHPNTGPRKQSKSCGDLPSTTPLKIKKLLMRSNSQSSENPPAPAADDGSKFVQSFPSLFAEVDKKVPLTKPNLAEECRKFEACLRALSNGSDSSECKETYEKPEKTNLNGLQKDGFTSHSNVEKDISKSQKCSKSNFVHTSLNHKVLSENDGDVFSFNASGNHINKNCEQNNHVTSMNHNSTVNGEFDVTDRNNHYKHYKHFSRDKDKKRPGSVTFPFTFLDFRKKDATHNHLQLTVHTHEELQRKLQTSANSGTNFFHIEPLKSLKSFFSDISFFKKTSDKNSFPVESCNTASCSDQNQSSNGYEKDSFSKYYWYHREENRKLSHEFAVRKFPHSSLPSFHKGVKNTFEDGSDCISMIEGKLKHYSDDLDSYRNNNDRLRKVSSTSDISYDMLQTDLLEETYQGSGDTFATKLSRYYHVFKKGELSNLIEKYVRDLDILETCYDHANWCNIVQKKYI